MENMQNCALGTLLSSLVLPVHREKRLQAGRLHSNGMVHKINKINKIYSIQQDDNSHGEKLGH